MLDKQVHTQEVFSFHCFKLPIYKLPFYLFFYSMIKKLKGLKHSELFVPMQLGEPLFSTKRYHIKNVSVLAFWQTEEDFNHFLTISEKDPILSGWHLRLKLYRRWGSVRELDFASLYPRKSERDTTTVAITLARLKLSQLFRFTKWGRPVEKQVRNHSGKKFALAAFRPFRNFLTFSIWNSEEEMIHGQRKRSPIRWRGTQRSNEGKG